MEKEEMLEQVKALIEAPSCCAPLKAAAEDYLAAVDTDMEDEAAKVLFSELGQDVNLIEESIAFFGSDKAKQMLGEERAEAMIASFREAMSKGERYCLCPACQAGSKLYEYFKALAI